MQLTLTDASRLLHASESVVIRWVWRQRLPCQRVAGQYWFNRAELLEWALAHQVKADAGEPYPHLTRHADVNLAAALEAGGIYVGIPGPTRDAALRELVARLPVPADFDRSQLLGLYQARLTVNWRVDGDGIALPSVRHAIVLSVPHSLATLAVLERAIVGSAETAAPIRMLFTLISPTLRAHVQMLSSLSRALQDPGFRSCVLGMRPPEAILREARRFDQQDRRMAPFGPRAA